VIICGFAVRVIIFGPCRGFWIDGGSGVLLVASGGPSATRGSGRVRGTVVVGAGRPVVDCVVVVKGLVALLLALAALFALLAGLFALVSNTRASVPIALVASVRCSRALVGLVTAGWLLAIACCAGAM
jgi:hypothetical protein